MSCDCTWGIIAVKVQYLTITGKEKSPEKGPRSSWREGGIQLRTSGVLDRKEFQHMPVKGIDSFI